MADQATPVITRFAPSPTGELHIGGARTALFAWAYAKRHTSGGGRFLLRFEDTDQKRSSKQAEQNILRDLEWLGLRGDNHDNIPRQSERLDLYNTALEKLKAAGLTYEDDGAVRFRMDKPVVFDDAVFGHIAVEEKDLEDFVIQKTDGFPTFHLAVVVDDADMGVTHVIRGQEHLSNTTKHAALYDALGEPRPVWCHTPSIMNPDGSKMSKRDKAKAARKAAKDNPELLGEISLTLAKVLAKDQKIGLEDISRGEYSIDASSPTVFREKLHRSRLRDWDTDKNVLNASQNAIQDFVEGKNDNAVLAKVVAGLLDLDLPEIETRDFRYSGYTVPVLLNYLALLGWNPGNDLERFDLDYLCEHFDFDRIGKSNSKFDRDKLAAFSQDTFLQMPEDEWTATLKDHFDMYFPNYVEQLGNGFGVFAMAYKERSKTLSDPAELGKFFVEAPSEYVPKAVKKNLTKNEGEGLKSLAKVRETLATLPVWEAEPIHASLDQLWQTLGLKNMGGVAQPLRVAMTGNAVSPEIGPTLEILGRDETLGRIDACLAAVTP
ncbi:MAG: glutamate--tRNA ligase family protein [Planctomycetota bacterium]